MQKIGLFRDLQVQSSCIKMAQNCQNRRKTDIYVLVAASQDLTNRDFYTPRLFAIPTEATQLTYALQCCFSNIEEAWNSIKQAMTDSCNKFIPGARIPQKILPKMV